MKQPKGVKGLLAAFLQTATGAYQGLAAGERIKADRRERAAGEARDVERHNLAVGAATAEASERDVANQTEGAAALEHAYSQNPAALAALANRKAAIRGGALRVSGRDLEPITLPPGVAGPVQGRQLSSFVSGLELPGQTDVERKRTEELGDRTELRAYTDQRDLAGRKFDAEQLAAKIAADEKSADLERQGKVDLEGVRADARERLQNPRLLYQGLKTEQEAVNKALALHRTSGGSPDADRAVAEDARKQWAEIKSGGSALPAAGGAAGAIGGASRPAEVGGGVAPNGGFFQNALDRPPRVLSPMLNRDAPPGTPGGAFLPDPARNPAQAPAAALPFRPNVPGAAPAAPLGGAPASSRFKYGTKAEAGIVAGQERTAQGAERLRLVAEAAKDREKWRRSRIEGERLDRILAERIFTGKIDLARATEEFSQSIERGRFNLDTFAKTKFDAGKLDPQTALNVEVLKGRLSQLGSLMNSLNLKGGTKAQAEARSLAPHYEALLRELKTTIEGKPAATPGRVTPTVPDVAPPPTLAPRVPSEAAVKVKPKPKARAGSPALPPAGGPARKDVRLDGYLYRGVSYADLVRLTSEREARQIWGK